MRLVTLITLLALTSVPAIAGNYGENTGVGSQANRQASQDGLDRHAYPPGGNGIAMGLSWFGRAVAAMGSGSGGTAAAGCGCQNDAGRKSGPV